MAGEGSNTKDSDTKDTDTIKTQKIPTPSRHRRYRHHQVTEEKALPCAREACRLATTCAPPDPIPVLRCTPVGCLDKEVAWQLLTAAAAATLQPQLQRLQQRRQRAQQQVQQRAAVRSRARPPERHYCAQLAVQCINQRRRRNGCLGRQWRRRCRRAAGCPTATFRPRCGRCRWQRSGQWRAVQSAARLAATAAVGATAGVQRAVHRAERRLGGAVQQCASCVECLGQRTHCLRGQPSRTVRPIRGVGLVQRDQRLARARKLHA
eukprot:353463-Chlamydomonas_euryale.AAC.1